MIYDNTNKGVRLQQTALGTYYFEVGNASNSSRPTKVFVPRDIAEQVESGEAQVDIVQHGTIWKLQPAPVDTHIVVWRPMSGFRGVAVLRSARPEWAPCPLAGRVLAPSETTYLHADAPRKCRECRCDIGEDLRHPAGNTRLRWPLLSDDIAPLVCRWCDSPNGAIGIAEHAVLRMRPGDAVACVRSGRLYGDPPVLVLVLTDRGPVVASYDEYVASQDV